MRFVASGLDFLTNNLVKYGWILSGFKDYSEEQYELLIPKGFYPHEYMKRRTRVQETELAAKEAFCSNLNMSKY